MLQLFLHLLIEIQAFCRIGFGHCRQRGLVQLRNFPAVQPGHGAGFAIVPREGAGVGMGVEIVRYPQTDRRLMLFRTYTGIHLATGGGQQIDLHAALCKARLHGLGDGNKRRLVLHVQRKVRVFDARFGENVFRFCRVKFERIIFQRTRQTDRQEALMDKILAFQQIFGDAFIIHQPAGGFPERRIIQQRVGAVSGVKHQIVLFGGRNAQHFHAGFAVERANLICTQIARHVRIALLDQQAARSRVRNIFNNDAFKRGRAARRGCIGFQHDGLMRLIDAHFERAAARRVHFQPRVAEVVIFHIR